MTAREFQISPKSKNLSRYIIVITELNSCMVGSATLIIVITITVAMVLTLAMLLRLFKDAEGL